MTTNFPASAVAQVQRALDAAKTCGDRAVEAYLNGAGDSRAASLGYIISATQFVEDARHELERMSKILALSVPEIEHAGQKKKADRDSR